MAGDKITANDLISSDVKKSIEDINSELQKLLKTVSEVAKTGIEMNASFKQVSTSQEDTAKKVKVVSDNLNTLTATEKEVQKIEAQTAKIIAQTAAQRTDEYKAMVKAKLERQQQAKDIQNEIKLRQAYSNEVEHTVKNLGDMRKELAALRNTSFAGKSAEEIDQIRTRIGELTKEMKDQRAMVAGMGEDFTVIAADSLKLFIAGIEGVTGALNVMGIESKTLEPLQKNIVSLIAISQALSEIQDGLEKRTIQVTLARIKDSLATAYDTVVKSLNVAASKASTKAEEARAVMSGKASLATKTAAAVQWLWNAAMAANPVGALIAGVALLVGGIYLLTKAFSSEIDTTEQLNNKLKELSEQKENMLSINEYFSKRAQILGQTDIENIKDQIDANDRLQENLQDEIDTLNQLYWSKKINEEQTKRLKEAEKEFDKAHSEGLNLELELKMKNQEAERKSALAFMEEKVLLSKKGSMAELQNKIAYLSYERDLYFKYTKDTAGEQFKMKAEYAQKIHEIELQEQELIKRDTLSRLEAVVLKTKETDVKIFDEKKAFLSAQLKWELKNETLTSGEKVKINADYKKKLEDLEQQRREFINQGIIAEQEAKISATQKDSIDEINAQRELLTIKFSMDIDNVNTTEQEKEKIRAKYNRDLINNEQDLANKLLQISDMNLQIETNALTDQYLKREISERQLSDKILDLQISEAEKELEIANITTEQKIALETKLYDLKKQKRKEDETNTQEYISKATDLAKGLFDYQSQLLDTELSNLEDEHQTKLQMAGDNAAEKARIDKEYAAKEKGIKKQKAESDKTAALFDAAINTAVNVTKVLYNPILVALVSALGAVQIATIMSKPIPKFAKGVRGFEGGLAEVGEIGRELVRTPDGNIFLTPDTATKMVLPKGTDVFTHNETESILRSGINMDKFDAMINEQRETRRALSNKIENHTNITSDGMEYIIKTGNTKTKRIDKYFRN